MKGLIMNDTTYQEELLDVKFDIESSGEYENLSWKKTS